MTSHTVNVSGLAASTTYHYQVLSQNAGGSPSSSGDFTFTTVAQPAGPQPLFLLHADASEVSGVTNGSVVTPSVAPSGFTGTVVVNGTGAVNYAAAASGNGVYFLNCCVNTSNAYYKFTGTTVGGIFNINQGQVSFYLKSRYSFAQRQANASSARYAFDVRDGNGHLFYFLTQVASGFLQFGYEAAGAAQNYYVPQGTEDTLFGNGAVLQVTLSWNGSTINLYLNGTLVKSAAYTPATPNWTSSSNFDLGAYEYLTYGGFNVSDDQIDEFTVTGPAIVVPSVSITAPSGGASLAGMAAVSANASDSVGVMQVQFQLDGANLSSPVTGAGPSYGLLWDTTTTTNGSHTLRAIATDAAGTSGTSSAVSVTVNNPVVPPVISGVSANSIAYSGATIVWTTDEASTSQVAYGTTNSYGSTTALNNTLVTSHTVNVSGLAASTTYHYQVLSQNAQGNMSSSGDFTFTTVAQPAGPQPLFLLHADASEVSGVTNGSVVTPSVAPSGFTGSVVVNGTGSVNYAPAQNGNGVYFLNCCGNTSNAYYKFTGAAIGSIFNTNQGQVSFYLQSRYSFAQRQASASSPRYAFDVRDGNGHLFYFLTEVASGRLYFGYEAAGAAQNYYVPQGTEDTLFGNGAVLQVTLSWNGSTINLYLNGTLVKSVVFTPTTPNWTAASNFDLGAYQYLTYGGFNVSDDLIDEFTVTGPAIVVPSVSITAPSGGASLAGMAAVSANASDSVGVMQVQFQLDGANLSSPVTGAGPSYGLSWNTTTATNASHTLTAIATDAAGNSGTSSAVSVTVNNPVVPPVISGVSANSIAYSGATIVWTTDQASTSQVAYGTTNTYGLTTTLNSTLVTSHSVNLSGLTASTTYHYQVLSQNAGGSPSSSGDFAFTTVAQPAGPQPLFLLSMPTLRR